MLRVGSFFFESARMDCTDFLTLLESILPSSSWLRCILSSFSSFGQVGSSSLRVGSCSLSKDCHSARVDFTSFKSAWLIVFSKNFWCAIVEPTRCSLESARVLTFQKSLHFTFLKYFSRILVTRTTLIIQEII